MRVLHSSASLESFLSSSVKALLHNAGFRVASSGFESIVEDESTRVEIQNEYSNEDVAKILLYFPDLFVMHDKLEPKRGVFFVKSMQVSKRTGKIRLKRQIHDTLVKYFPTDRLLLVVWNDEKSSDLWVSWFDDMPWSVNGDTFDASSRSLEELTKFAKRNFGVQFDADDLNALHKNIESLSNKSVD